eukprot:gene25973-47150_t
MSRMFEGVTLGGQHFRDFVGVVFTYDFSPLLSLSQLLTLVMVVMEE